MNTGIHTRQNDLDTPRRPRRNADQRSNTGQREEQLEEHGNRKMKLKESKQ